MYIFPFVRYAQILVINKNTQFRFLKSYDCRLFYCLCGVGKIIVDGVSYKMMKGCLIIWQPGRCYHLISDPENPLKLIGVNFDFTMNNSANAMPIPPAKEDVFLANNIVEFFHDSDFDNTVFLDDMDCLEQPLLCIRSEYKEMRIFYSQIINGILGSVLYRVKRTLNTITDNKKSEKPVEEIIEYIASNYLGDLSNYALAKQFNYHPNYMNRLMKMYTGMSLHQYVLSRKIASALKMIETTSMPISEIAESVGFCDVSHFSKCFKKKTGRNPSDFR